VTRRAEQHEGCFEAAEIMIARFRLSVKIAPFFAPAGFGGFGYISVT
jgi:hypothetical protein